MIFEGLDCGLVLFLCSDKDFDLVEPLLSRLNGRCRGSCTGALKRVLARLGAFYGGSVNTTRIRGRKLAIIRAEMGLNHREFGQERPKLWQISIICGRLLPMNCFLYHLMPSVLLRVALFVEVTI